MPIVTWSDAYNVNVGAIDAQHQEMLKLANNLHASAESGEDKDNLQEMLSELVDYTRMHFATEEELMKKHDYPDYPKHHKEHKILLQHMESILGAVSIGKFPNFYANYDVSTDWMFNHISESDKLLGEFLNARNVY